MNEIQRFDGNELQRGETMPAALAARETAVAQARFIMAMQRPRNVEKFRVRLLAECDRTGFAETAEYYKPVGKKKNEETNEWEQQYATGPSIRLIEVAAQYYGNLDVQSQVLHETEEHRVVECAAIDLETNTRWSENRLIPRTVEKRGDRIRGSKEVGPPSGRDVISERTNTYGDKVYVCRATADEVQQKQGAETSKSLRTQVTRLLPRDIIDEALQRCRQTIQKEITQDPKASLRRLIDGFAEMGVSPEDLEIWAGGRKLEQLSPKELQQLRQLWTGLRDKETTWKEAMEARDPQGSAAASEAVGKAKIDALKATQQPAATATVSATAEPVKDDPPPTPTAAESQTPPPPPRKNGFKL